MSEYRSQIQNLFLSTARKKHLPVEVVLNTGTSLRGKIKGYDQFSITLMFKEKLEVIYKSSILIVTIMSKRRSFPVKGPLPDGPSRHFHEYYQDSPAPSPRRMPYPGDDESDPPPPRKPTIKR